jgi:hypothetical protein
VEEKDRFDELEQKYGWYKKLAESEEDQIKAKLMENYEKEKRPFLSINGYTVYIVTEKDSINLSERFIQLIERILLTEITEEKYREYEKLLIAMVSAPTWNILGRKQPKSIERNLKQEAEDEEAKRELREVEEEIKQKKNFKERMKKLREKKK